MTLDQLTARYSALTERQRVVFLSQLASELTVAARGTYVADTDAVADPPRLRELNEFQHRVTGHLRDVLTGNRTRRPDDVFCALVFEWNREMSLNALLERCLSSAERFKRAGHGGQSTRQRRPIQTR
jgi:hypothetical protein